MYHPCIEPLESRRLLTAYVVDTLGYAAGDGDGSTDGSLSLREAVVAATTNAAFGDAPAGSSFDTITFADDLDGGTINLENGELVLSGGGEIVLRGDVTVDAGGDSRILNVDGLDRFRTSGLTLTGGNADNGAALLIDGGDVRVSDTTFDSNVATGDDADNGGGAIYTGGAFVRIADSSFTNNSAIGTAGSGGALFVLDGNVRVDGGSFDGNVANRAGGGIEVAAGTLRLCGASFTGNVAGPDGSAAPGNGGALHVSGAATVGGRGLDVDSNVAAAEGGGFWNSATGSIKLIDSSFEANTASGDAADNGGGGVYHNGGDVSLFRATLDDNDATGDSGSGGGLLSVGGQVTILSSGFDANTANRAGGGIEIVDGSFRFDDGTLSNNSTGANPGNGGAFHVTGMDTTSTFNKATVTGNFAAGQGGGLWNQAGSVLTVNDSTISGNTTDGRGGGVYNNGGSALFGDSVITDNTAGVDGVDGVDGGGIFTDEGGVTTLVDTDVFGNDPNDLAGPGTVS